jgi:hypothetical protein
MPDYTGMGTLFGPVAGYWLRRKLATIFASLFCTSSRSLKISAPFCEDRLLLRQFGRNYSPKSEETAATRNLTLGSERYVHPLGACLLNRTALHPLHLSQELAIAAGAAASAATRVA